MSLAEQHHEAHGVGCRAYIVDAPTEGLTLGPRTYLTHNLQKATATANEMASFGHEVVVREVTGRSFARSFLVPSEWYPLARFEAASAQIDRPVGERITEGFALLALAGDSEDDRGA